MRNHNVKSDATRFLISIQMQPAWHDQRAKQSYWNDKSLEDNRETVL